MKIPKHFHSTKHITKKEIVNLFSEIENSADYVSTPEYPGIIVANAFLEPSLHTEISFNIALEKMSVKIINFRSMNLAEIINNPLRILHKLEMHGVDLIVLRSHEKHLFDALENFNIPTISAGCNDLGNPTEELQDLYTIWAKFRNWSKLKILAIGDVEDSWQMESALKLYDHLNFDVDKICMSNFDSLVDFLNEVKIKSLGTNVFHLLRDSNDNFEDFSTSMNGYSKENIDVFNIILNNFINKESLIINSGTKRLSALFDGKIYRDLRETERQRMINGNNVRMHLIHKMISTYRM